jgi:hypothetical protein
MTLTHTDSRCACHYDRRCDIFGCDVTTTVGCDVIVMVDGMAEDVADRGLTLLPVLPP